MILQDITLAHYQQNDLQAVKQFQLLEIDNKFVKTPYDNIIAAIEDYHRYPIMVWRNNDV